MSTDLGHLLGKKLTVYFKETTNVNGQDVAAVSGVCGGGWKPGPLIINDIHTALDPKGKDITAETKLAGSNLTLSSEGVKLIIEAK